MNEDDQKQAPGLSDRWEQAYLVQAREAAVGRLFRGIIHNLNGVLQVASLQGEMSAFTGKRVDELLARARGGSPQENAELLWEIEKLLDEQKLGVEQFREKIAQGAEILRRTLQLPALNSELVGVWSLNEIVRCEVEFLAADSFFKHKVDKRFSLDPQAPPLKSRMVLVHEVVHQLLRNALEAVVDKEGAEITVTTTRTTLPGDDSGGGSEGVVMEISDNGPGVGEDGEKIFLPFFSRREGHQGLGLYLARNLARACGGELLCLAGRGGSFRLTLPPAG